MEWPRAEIPIEKFRDYSMDPGHPKNGGKHKGFELLGFALGSLEERQRAAQDVVEQLSAVLRSGDFSVQEQEASEFGRQFLMRSHLVGPRGLKGTLVTAWQEPETGYGHLTTNWVEVWRESL